jgi:Phage P22-like portal protein
MARMTKTERLQKKHSEALKGFDVIWSGSQETRLQCTETRRFTYIPGAQWEGRLGEQFENKPKPEVNKVALSVQRIVSEYRNNRVTADFIPKDGSEADELADVCDGLYRADEQDSCAEEAYDNAFEEGVSGGMGAWRLRAEYENEEDDDDEHQRIRIEPIFDADSCVFFDLDARKYDKGDARTCYVLYAMTFEAFKAEYKVDPATWPKDQQVTGFDWCRPNLVYLAEYYEVETVRETVHIFVDTGEADNPEVRYTEDEMEAILTADGYVETEGTDAEELEAMLAAMAERGFIKVREKKAKRRKVHKYIMSGNSILEDCGYIAGKNIPIVPFYAKRLVIDGIERIIGHVTYSKDVQRIGNAQYGKLLELAAKSSDGKPIFTPEQVAGHQVMWQEDNIKDYPYLLVNPITDAQGNPVPSGPVAYTQPLQIPPALAALLQFSQNDMMDILGRPQDGQELLSNVSGKAVEMIQQRLDIQTYLYTSNFAKSVRRSGEVWLSMSQDLYVEDERRMKTVGRQGNTQSVVLNQETIDGKTGKLMEKNSLRNANLDVTCSVGPSFESKRAAIVRALTGLMALADDPADRKVLLAGSLMNMEGEGLESFREYYRKQLVQMGVEEPNEEEREAMEAAAAEPQPDPNAEFLASEAAKNDSVAALNEAKRLEIASKIDKTVAETENVDADTALKEAMTLDKLRGDNAQL